MTDEKAQQLGWQSCRIDRIVSRTPNIKSFFLRLSEPFVHVAGQHVDIRLTAPDGYTAMRSYSIASTPASSPVIELTIERLEDGEVSPVFHDVAEVGDEIELRGPLGGHFLWPEATPEPILLIGGGSGVVPLMAMVRQRGASEPAPPVALLVSARTVPDVPFASELLATVESDASLVLALAITRAPPVRASDFSRHIDGSMIAEVIGRLPRPPAHVFVCGSNGFVNVATDAAIAAGLPASAIKTERYGG